MVTTVLHFNVRYILTFNANKKKHLNYQNQLPLSCIHYSNQKGRWTYKLCFKIMTRWVVELEMFNSYVSVCASEDMCTVLLQITFIVVHMSLLVFGRNSFPYRFLTWHHTVYKTIYIRSLLFQIIIRLLLLLVTFLPELPSCKITRMVFNYFVDNIWSVVINEAITAMFEICRSSWDRGKIRLRKWRFINIERVDNIMYLSVFWSYCYVRLLIYLNWFVFLYLVW